MAESKSVTVEARPVGFLGVDVEKKGAMFKHPIIQIGAAYGTCLKDIATASFCFDYKDVPFEERCYTEFWSKYPDVYKKICAAAQPPEEQWPAFARFLDQLEAKYPKIEIVTDNPAYDIEAIDGHLDVELGRAGLRYSSTMKYRSVHDSTEIVKGLPAHYQKAIAAKTEKLAPHTHWAEDDARGILTHFFLTRAVVKELRSAEMAIDAILSEPDAEKKAVQA